MNINLRKKEKGFTLQELVVVTAVIAILSGTVTAFFIYGRKIISLQNYSIIAENEALEASLVISRELRDAHAPEGLSYPAIEEATSFLITFYTHLTDEGANNHEEKIRYALVGNQIRRDVSYWNENAGDYDPLPPLSKTESKSRLAIDSLIFKQAKAQRQIICNYVVNNNTPILYYYDANYTGSQDPMVEPIGTGQIKVVNLHLLIDVNPNRDPRPFEHNTFITLRNL